MKAALGMEEEESWRTGGHEGQEVKEDKEDAETGIPYLNGTVIATYTVANSIACTRKGKL